MFWNRIFKRNEWGYPVYQTQNGWYERLATRDEVKDGFEHVHKKFNLILDHLNLEYVPETEKKEPAKLVEKVKKPDFTICGIPGFIDCTGMVNGSGDTTLTSTPKKKKRGRPKKK